MSNELITPPEPSLEEMLLSLTAKQRLYVENRVNGLPPIAAMTAAGYSEDSRPYEIEGNPKVKLIMFQLTRGAVKEMTMTRSHVIQGFMDAVDAASTSTELTMAWREIGKVIGAYEPAVVVHKTQDITPEKIENMSDADLLKMSAQENFKLTEEDAIDGEFEEVMDQIESAPEAPPEDEESDAREEE